MADEELDLNLDEEQVNPVEKRIKNLSDKVRTTAEERDAERAANAEKEAKLLQAEKERDFFKNFNQVSSKYQGASDFQDKILEKVNAGYDLEDATISILAKEGKYQPQAVETPAPKESPAGGSAINTMSGGGEKALGEMNLEEKKALVEEALNKGDISFKNL